MKTVPTLLAAAGLITVGAWPALAQDEVDPETLSCSDFLAMSVEDQASAVETLEVASVEAESTGEAGATTEGEATGESDAGTDSSAEDATASEETTTEGDASTAADSGSDASGDMSAAEEMVASLTTACEGDPDMLAMDAMADMEDT